MKPTRSVRPLIAPAVFMGGLPGLLTLGGALFRLGMPAELALLVGLSAGFALALLVLRKM